MKKLTLILAIALSITTFELQARTCTKELYKKAHKTFKKHRYDLAYKYYRVCRHSDLMKISDHLQYGISAYHFSHFDVARKRLLFVLSQNPTNKRANYYLGHLYFSTMKYTAAIRRFKKSQEYNFRVSECYYYIGYIQFLIGRYSEAISNLNRARHSLGGETYQRSDFYIAMSYYEKWRRDITDYSSFESAMRYFAYAADNKTNPEISRRANTYLKALPKEKASSRSTKKFFATSRFGTGYDNNVTEAPMAASRIDSMTLNVTPYLAMKIFRKKTWRLDGTLNVDYTKYFKESVHDYDYLSPTVKVKFTYHGWRISPGISYSFNPYFVKQTPELDIMTHSVEPSIRVKTFLNSPLTIKATLKGKDNRSNSKDAIEYGGSITQKIVVPWVRIFVFNTYSFLRLSSRKNGYIIEDYNHHQYTLSSRFDLPWRFTFIPTVELNWKQYYNDSTRNTEFEQKYSISLAKEFLRYLEWSTKLEYVDVDSINSSKKHSKWTALMSLGMLY